jgi:hypothetical protein
MVSQLRSAAIPLQISTKIIASQPFKDPIFLPGGIFLDHWMQAELIYGHVIYLEFTWPTDLVIYKFDIHSDYCYQTLGKAGSSISKEYLD